MPGVFNINKIVPIAKKKKKKKKNETKEAERRERTKKQVLEHQMLSLSLKDAVKPKPQILNPEPQTLNPKP